MLVLSSVSLVILLIFVKLNLIRYNSVYEEIYFVGLAIFAGLFIYFFIRLLYSVFKSLFKKYLLPSSPDNVYKLIRNNWTDKEIVVVLVAILSIFVVLVGGFYLVKNINSAGTVANNKTKNAFKAVVEIKTIIQNKDFGMSEGSSGSGVVISSGGLVLTNNHVIAGEEVYDEAGYNICITKDIGKSADCSYVAKLIEVDEYLDLALLQIEPIEGLSEKKSFDYLDLNTTDKTQIGDRISVIGYSAIGEDTITLTQGIVSGKKMDYEQKWIKTDAIVAHGNSGGAAIDSSGKIVGIPSLARDDSGVSLGYLINAETVNAWLKNKKDGQPKDILFQDKLINFVKKRQALLTQDNFVNLNPGFTVTKPSDWSFGYAGENDLYMDKKGDYEGGFLSINTIKKSTSVSLENIIPILKQVGHDSDDSYYPIVIEDRTLKIANLPAKKISYYDKQGNISNGYYMPYENYLVVMSYQYGVADKDKKIVDQIVNSLKVEKSAMKYAESNEYVNEIPRFKLKFSNDWSVLEQNVKFEPAEIYNNKIKEAFFYARVEGIDEDKKDISNEEYLNEMKKTVEAYNRNIPNIDSKLEIIEMNPSVAINKSITNGMADKMIRRSVSSDNIQMQSAAYTIKRADKYITIGFRLYSDNPELYKQAQLKLNELMQGFSFD